jgi:hypothetical protein
MKIKTYTFNQKFKTVSGVQTYSGHIYARSFEEAQALCQKFDAVCDGELVAIFCEVCGDNIMRDAILDTECLYD